MEDWWYWSDTKTRSTPAWSHTESTTRNKPCFQNRLFVFMGMAGTYRICLNCGQWNWNFISLSASSFCRHYGTTELPWYCFSMSNDAFPQSKLDTVRKENHKHFLCTSEKWRENPPVHMVDNIKQNFNHKQWCWSNNLRFGIEFDNAVYKP